MGAGAVTTGAALAGLVTPPGRPSPEADRRARPWIAALLLDLGAVSGCDRPARPPPATLPELDPDRDPTAVDAERRP